MNFTIHNSEYTEHPYLGKAVPDHIILHTPLTFFDREGYELAVLEQQLYERNGVALSDHLNHVSVAQDWISKQDKSSVQIDHCSLFTRYAYEGALRLQLLTLRPQRYELNKLLAVKPKFGFDISIDYVDENTFLELLHIEKDFASRNAAIEQKVLIEKVITGTDWQDFAKYLLNHRDEWINLCSDDESDYKARLLGINRAFDNIKVYHEGDISGISI